MNDRNIDQESELFSILDHQRQSNQTVRGIHRLQDSD